MPDDAIRFSKELSVMALIYKHLGGAPTLQQLRELPRPERLTRSSRLPLPGYAPAIATAIATVFVPASALWRPHQAT